MDEFTTPIPSPEPTVPSGDVDDLIFCDDPEGYASQR